MRWRGSTLQLMYDAKPHLDSQESSFFHGHSNQVLLKASWWNDYDVYVDNRNALLVFLLELVGMRRGLPLCRPPRPGKYSIEAWNLPELYRSSWRMLRRLLKLAC